MKKFFLLVFLVYFWAPAAYAYSEFDINPGSPTWPWTLTLYSDGNVDVIHLEDNSNDSYEMRADEQTPPYFALTYNALKDVLMNQNAATIRIYHTGNKIELVMIIPN